MVAGIGNKCVKAVFFTFNFLFFVLGGLILGLALWIRFDNDFQTKLSDSIRVSSGQLVQLDQMYLALYIAAGFGGLLCLTGFLGCCGACCESICLIGFFFTIVLVLFVAEICGAVYVFVKKDTIKEQIANWYKTHLIDKYDDVNEKEIRNQLDQIQAQYGCCGARGCEDYADRLQGAPDSCGCSVPRPGCSNKAFETISANMVVVAAISIGVLAVELLAMIFSCVLCNAVRNSAYDYY